MIDATPVQIDLISPTFFFYSHGTRFTESTPSTRVYSRQVSTVNDARGLELVFPLNFLLKDLVAGYSVIKPIAVKVEQTDGSFVASFVAANVNASGETWDEAVLNLKSLLVDKFDMLLSHKSSTLGPAPKRQLSVLQSFIRRSANDKQRTRA